MKVAYIALFLSLALSGCVTDGTTSEPAIIKTKPVVVQPPAYFYNCPANVIRRMGDDEIAKLTNAELAKLVVKLSQRGDTCDDSLRRVQQYLKKAAEEYNAQPTTP
jgi:hypothetical protein